MSPVLDGVRIGPVDPDRGENFGQVGGSATARQLIRHHVALTPPALAAALRRQRQDERSESLDVAEVEDYIRGFYEDAGEPIPEDSEITGLAVRGLEEQPKLQVLTFTFITKGGRSAKGFVPYRDKDGSLSKSVAAGDEAVRIKKLKDAGLPWAPSQAALAVAGITGTGVAEPEVDDEDDEPEGSGISQADLDAAETRADAEKARADELERRLKELEAQAPTDAQTAGGGSGVASSPQTPEGGSPDLTVQSTPIPEGGDTSESLGAALGLTSGYDEGKAQDIRAKLRESRDHALARRVLDYETRGDAGQNRSTVTGAANELLDHAPPAG